MLTLSGLEVVVVEVGFRLGAGGVAPTRAHPGDAGWDLALAHAATIPPRSFRDLSTQVYVDQPPGVWHRITGRSSTLRKYGLLIQEGIIDTGYQGELFVGAFNLTDEVIRLDAGTRVAQVIFSRHVDITWREVEAFNKSDRGTRGFGSSGV